MDIIKAGQSVLIEECIMQKGLEATGGSKILEGFIAPFDAAVVERLNTAGITVKGRVQMAEFGIGDYGKSDLAHAIVSLQNSDADFVLCNDYSGKIRLQASLAGLCYIHPCYGTVSRYGLIPAAPSMDQIGILCRDINAGFDLLSIIAGHDSRDGAMLPHISYSYGPDAAPPKLGVPKNLSNENGFAEKYNCEEFQLEYYETYGHVMDILSSAEIANSISRYDGIKFGYRSGDYGSLNELYVKSRSEGLGPGGKLASVLGALVLSHDMYHPVYERAMKLRRLIRDRLPLDTFGVMALPVTGTADILRGLGALPALAGLWAGSFPVSGGGIQLIAPPGNENKLLKAWEVCTK